MSRIKTVVVSGSTSRPSRTLQLSEHILSAVARESAVEAHVVDLADVGSDLGRALSRTELSAAGEGAVSLVESADLLIAATPVYRGSYTGHFKH
ncbi:MAG TPA: NAD(P)H-dependent oxidoreductase, partial [Polyangiaceae bacterium]|nr:NAD(P)H-dependent oxidoreductase [Polyangiaceae bacterium]